MPCEGARVQVVGGRLRRVSTPLASGQVYYSTGLVLTLLSVATLGELHMTGCPAHDHPRVFEESMVQGH